MKMTLIAAMDEKQLIGAGNDLPWRLPADLKFFKQQTMNKTILMGRKTCQSLPFPLPKRRNLVLSRNADFERDGFEVLPDLDQLPANLDELMVIGGGGIYELLLPQATHMILTRIHKTLEGDTYFPAVDWSQWQLMRRTNHPISEDNPDFAYDFEFYKKLQ